MVASRTARAVWLAPLFCACSGSGDAPPPEVVRPVTVVVLEQSAPELSGRLTGLAEPYRQDEVGFEVSGRVALVRDVGLEVEGPILDAAGGLVRGLLRWREPDPVERRFVEQCLRERGYQPIGWR